MTNQKDYEHITLKWVYTEGGSTAEGNGWVDYVQFTAKSWSEPSPQQDPANFQEISYKHDVYGRRSEKEVDGFPLGTPYGAAHGTYMTAPTLSPNTTAIHRTA